MHVRKFEADTIDEALKNIKLELGPDAIILKTVTNKGLKGTFKKKKVEITAAISEKNYLKKAQVDRVLGPEQKQQFYSASAKEVAQQIDRYNGNPEEKSASPLGYGALGLNKTVKMVRDLGGKVKADLDSFLSGKKSAPTTEDKTNTTIQQFVTEAPETTTNNALAMPTLANNEENLQMQARLDELERKLYVLNQSVSRFEKKEPHNVYQLRTILRSLDIKEAYIQKIIKRLIFELNDQDINNAETVFEFALREMTEEIHVEMPLFSSVDNESGPVVTVLVSETSSGQSAMAVKLGALRKEAVIIKLLGYPYEDQESFAEKAFDMNIVRVKNVPEAVTEIRKAVEQNHSVFVDYKAGKEINDTKNFIDGLRRSFEKVEVLVCLSAIHSELYNKKVISFYRSLTNGLILPHLDQCLSFGPIFNIAEEEKKLPFKFYGTGTVVPDDLEAATAERIMAGIFQLE
jgi:flagellar biosynthesis protein FlhF